MRAARDAIRRRRRVAVRQPDPVQRGRRPRRLPALGGRATRRSPRDSASTRCSPRPADEIYPDGFATTDPRRRPRRRARGRRARRRSTSTASAPWSASCSTSSRPTSPTSARRTRSRSSSLRRMIRDLDLPVADRDRPDRARGRRPRALLAATRVSGRPTASARTALSRALARRADAIAAGERDPAAAAPAAARRWPRPASSPSTSPSSTPTRSSRSSASRAGVLVARGGPRRAGPADRQRPPSSRWRPRPRGANQAKEQRCPPPPVTISREDARAPAGHAHEARARCGRSASRSSW